jgi:hypothetical protein
MMKKVFLIIINVIMLSANCNCQWYNRRYGESDINQLSQVQLNESLDRAKDGISSGAVISIISGIAIAGGIIMLTRESPYPGDIEGNVTGLLLIAASIPFEIIGLTVWSTNKTRAKSINEVLRNPDLKLGLVNCQMGNMFSGYQGSLLPCVSLTIHF